MQCRAASLVMKAVELQGKNRLQADTSHGLVFPPPVLLQLSHIFLGSSHLFLPL